MECVPWSDQRERCWRHLVNKLLHQKTQTYRNIYLTNLLLNSSNSLNAKLLKHYTAVLLGVVIALGMLVEKARS